MAFGIWGSWDLTGLEWFSLSEFALIYWRNVSSTFQNIKRKPAVKDGLLRCQVFCKLYHVPWEIRITWKCRWLVFQVCTGVDRCDMSKTPATDRKSLSFCSSSLSHSFRFQPLHYHRNKPRLKYQQMQWIKNLNVRWTSVVPTLNLKG